MVVLWYRDCFMKNFRFDTLCNITQEPQELQILNNAFGFIGKPVMINVTNCCHKLQVLAANRVSTSTNANASSSIPPYASLCIMG